MLVLNLYILEFDIASDLELRISSLCYINSTNSYVRIYKQFMQNKPNFPHFSLENACLAKKQTQFKPNQSQFQPKNEGGKAKQTQFYPRFKLTLLSCRGSKPISIQKFPAMLIWVNNLVSLIYICFLIKSCLIITENRLIIVLFTLAGEKNKKFRSKTQYIWEVKNVLEPN